MKDAPGGPPRAWWGAAVGRSGSNLRARRFTPGEAESGWTAPGCLNSWSQGACMRQH